MPLPKQTIDPVPEETAQVARKAFPKGICIVFYRYMQCETVEFRGLSEMPVERIRVGQ